MNKILSNCLIICLLLVWSLFGYAAKEVALTIDDLPFVGHAGNSEGKLRREKKRFRMILETLRKHDIPAAGFVVAGSIEPGQMALLNEFLQGRNIIGNHTYSHPCLSRTSADNYIKNVDRADKVLTPLMNSRKYFRYPCLAEGNTPEKYFKVRKHLKSNNYVVAPVTIDSKDYRYNAHILNINWRVRKQYLNKIRQRYLDYIENRIDKAETMAAKKVGRPIKQILLIHMNYLNAYLLEDVINLFKKRGYTFIPLKDALSDPFYRTYNHRFTNHVKK